MLKEEQSPFLKSVHLSMAFTRLMFDIFCNSKLTKCIPQTHMGASTRLTIHVMGTTQKSFELAPVCFHNHVLVTFRDPTLVCEASVMQN